MTFKDKFNGILNGKKKKTPQEIYEEKLTKRNNRKVTMITLDYDAGQDCYIWDERTNGKLGDVPPRAVHETGKKNTHVLVKFADKLIWPEGNQSAIHMYIWMINERMDPDKISEKKKATSNMDWKKILMIAGAVILIILIAPSFMR